MGPNKERRNRSSGSRPLFSRKPTPGQIADAEDLINGLHKTRAVNDEERDNLQEAVRTHKVTDPVIDVEELSKYGSKRIRNLIDVVSSSPGYVKIPVDSMGALDHALGLAEEAEAQLQGPILTRRSLLLGFGATAAAGILYIAYNIPQNKDQVIAVKPAAPPAPPVPVIASPSPIPSAAPAVKIIPPGAPIAEKARLILEEDYLGPEAVKKAFGISLTPDQIPQIPFNQEEIEWAKGLGEMLVLRTGTYSGRPLTGQVMESILGDQFYKNGKSEVFFAYSIKEKNRPVEGGKLYFNQAPRPGWALVSKAPIKTSFGKGYLDQTQALVDYLTTKEFVHGVIPKNIDEAIKEFDSKIRGIDKIDREDTRNYGNAAIPLVELKINQLARPTFAEVCFDLLVYFQNTGKRLLSEESTWTATLAARYDSVPLDLDRIVSVGKFSEKGIVFDIELTKSRYQDFRLGTMISRR